MTSKAELKEQGYTFPEEGLPAFGRPVTVVTPSFRCLGFLDKEQSWRQLKDHVLITDVIAWAVPYWERGENVGGASS
jgi:hypothetical protein